MEGSNQLLITEDNNSCRRGDKRSLVFINFKYVSRLSSWWKTMVIKSMKEGILQQSLNIKAGFQSELRPSRQYFVGKRSKKEYGSNSHLRQQ